MIVGYMRSFKNPNHMAKLLAMLCEHHRVRLLYFNPTSVLINSNKIKGKMLFNNKWIEVEVSTPKFIDINPNFFNRKKYQTIIEHLKEHAKLSADKRMPLPKDRLHEAFQDDNNISKYLIPTKNINSFNDIEHFVNEFNTVVIKPVYSNQGRNVFILKKEGNNKYVLGYSKKENKVNMQDLSSFYTEKIHNKRFIIQKYIESITPQGHPFDCRVHMEKNGKNKWFNVKNFIRIGIGQKVISNISQGGGIADLKDFLSSTYNDNWEDIYKEIKETAKVIPNKVEEVLGQQYMTMGFDIGIEPDGSLYLYEINDYPIVSPMRSEVAMARAEYYKYMLMN